MERPFNVHFMSLTSSRYKILLDVFPFWGLMIILLILGLIFTIVAFVGVFITPTSRQTRQVRTPYHQDYFTNRRPIVASIEGLSPNNLQLTTSFFFAYNNSLFDIEKTDLQISLKYEVQVDGNWTNWSGVDKDGLSTDIRVRTLYCSKGYNYNIWSGDIFTFNLQTCNRLVLHQEKIFHSGYRLSLVLMNANKLFTHKVLNGDIVTEFEFTDASFTIFETVIRSVYSFIAFCFFVAFPIVAFKTQHILKFHTHQKWMIPLLFFHIFYHDPIYWASVFLGYANVFQIFNLVMSLLFIFIYCLYLLIFLHSLFVKPKDRTFFKFYLFKIVLVLILFALTATVTIWSLVWNAANPSHVSITELPGFIYFQWTTIGFIVIYVCYVLYFVMRAVVNVRKLPTKYSTRFRIVAALSIFVLITFTSVLILEGRTKFTLPGFSFLMTHTIILMYFCFLGFFFMPSAVPDTEEVDVVKEEKLDDHKIGEVGLNTTEDDLRREENVQLNFTPQQEDSNIEDHQEEHHEDGFTPYNPEAESGTEVN